MDKKIFLPDAEQTRQLIENAWNDFCRKAKEAGYNIDEKSAGGFIYDGFVAGYSYGYNDMLNVIRDQFRMMDVEREVFNDN